ncbi:8392_t:CDS:1, partial [Funneliformis geosporum]
NLHLFDSCVLKFDQLRVNYPTFKSYNSTSQIDYVWISTEAALHLLDCKTIEVSSQLSDHMIVLIRLENFLDIKNNNRNIPMKTVFDYNKMTDDRWTQF